ncbi:hypothetical protein AB1K84_21575 [Mesobacillus foraminis]|uniref:hypothetical protein n=1 Tax=Mesobacillus foraminis TaxID=279826 RepID=UPI0039A222EB
MKTILWVDDEIGVLDLLALYLAPRKYSCLKKTISQNRESHLITVWGVRYKWVSLE